MPQNEPRRVIIARGLSVVSDMFLIGGMGEVRVFGGWFGGGSIVRVSHDC